jgi:hypothetical protein
MKIIPKIIIMSSFEKERYLQIKSLFGHLTTVCLDFVESDKLMRFKRKHS